jgi:polysaccharide pyruvyl transferase WcaK-like protein
LRLFPLAFLSRLFSFLGIKLPLPEDVRFLKESNVLLDIGGITFNDGRLLFLLFNVFTIWPALLLRVPVVKLSQAMGPFKQPINRLVSQIFLRKCHHIFARGKETVAHLEDLKLPNSQWSPADDVAFLYQDSYSLSSENEERIEKLLGEIAQRKISGDSKTIAIVPSVLLMKKAEKQGLNYCDMLLEVMKTVEDESCQYIIFPNASRESSEKSRNNDIVTIRAMQEKAVRIFSEATQKRMHWVDYDINTSAIRRIVDMADVLITSRFHAMVSGLITATPTVVIGWSHKYHETLETFGMENYALHLNSEMAETSAKVQFVLLHQEELKQKLLQAQDQVLSSAESQFNQIEDLLV